MNLDWLTSVDPLICKIQRADLHKVTGKSKGPIVTGFLYLQRCVHWAPHIILFVLPLGNNHETFVVCNLLLSLVYMIYCPSPNLPHASLALLQKVLQPAVTKTEVVARSVSVFVHLHPVRVVRLCMSYWKHISIPSPFGSCLYC